MFNRTNIPFLIAGAIASLTLLTSGVFTVAPYVAFLSSVAALNVTLPVIFILFALSAVVIAFSYKMIKQNKKSQENSKAEVKKPDKELRKEKNTPPLIRKELEAKENKEKPSDLKRETDEISKLIDNFATKDEMEGVKKEFSSIKAMLKPDITKDKEVEAKLNMEFYAKDEERGWNTTLNDLVLTKSIKEKLKKVCELQHGGYLLNGKGGTGKSSICGAIANEIKSQFAVIRVSASSLCNISNIDRVFEKARENSPCIIIMEEIDGIGLNRESGRNKNVESLTHLLDKLNETFLKKNIVIATTNCASDLDGALVRCGRLECIEIPGLNKDDTRQKILQEQLKLKASDITTLVNASKGFSMANLTGLIANIKKEGGIKHLRTFCRKFKEDHNIKDEQDKKHRNSKIKNGESSRSLSVSPLLSDVSFQESRQRIKV